MTPTKLTLSTSRDIPFNKLVLSQANVRRIKAGLSIEQLAEDIALRTLLQSLTVRPILDGDGTETGLYDVPVGGRRYRALELLVKQKRLARTAPVPCVIRTDGLAAEDSLAENLERAPLHPLDQFRAFQTLREAGLGDEDIAARFFVTPVVVRQRLRLVTVSPRLLDLYAEDQITLEQVMAFSVTSDHARQEQVWDSLVRAYNREPYYIRKLLTEGTVRAADKRVRFVGIEAFEAAGGVVQRDLFEPDGGGWLQNPALLDRLVAEKLAAAAETVRAEGWKWIEVAPDFPYGHTARMRRLIGTPIPLTEADQAERDQLQAEYDRLIEAHAGADAVPEEIERQVEEIGIAMAAFDDRPLSFDPAEILRAGVFVSIDADGDLRVDRGYVRPEDERSAEPLPSVEAVTTIPVVEPGMPVAEPGPANTEPPEEDEGLKPLPDRLVAELTAHRTLGPARCPGPRSRCRLPRCAACAVPAGLLSQRCGFCPRHHRPQLGFHRPAARSGRHRAGQGDRCPSPDLARAVAGRSRRSVGHADRVRRRQPGGVVRSLRRADRQRGARALDPAWPRPRPCRPSRPGGGTRHGSGGLGADRRHLSRPGHQGPHP